jgi:segregation and condensation protein A
MDGITTSDPRLDEAAIGSSPRTATMEDWLEAGEGGSPSLTLDGFSGPLDHLLTLARRQKIDFSKIPLASLVDQLVTALRQAPANIPLGQQGDWVVMAAWLVQLRSRLLLPADASAQQDATAEANRFRTRLVALEDAQALALWLERRPQLGHDGFARGQPEIFGISVEARQAVDVIEFLWASLALFDDDVAQPETTTLYRPQPLELYAVAEARERILRRLAEIPDAVPLEQLLPDAPDITESRAREILRRRSAWSSTLVASLELAKLGDVLLEQDAVLVPIHVSLIPPTPPAAAASHEPQS